MKNITKRNSLLLFSFLLLIAVTAILSCNKTKDNTPEYDLQSARDNAWAENTFSDIFKWVDDAARSLDDSLYGGGKGINASFSKGCATISITPFDTISWPKKLVIDFGLTNCMCIDGKWRRGKIISILTGRYRDSLTMITDSLDDFHVNNYHIQGTKIVTNLGRNSSGNINFTVEIQQATISTLSGVIYWNATRNREWIAGENTIWPNIFDDEYLLTGSTAGINVFGNPFTVTILTPLLVAINCKWIKGGTLEIDPIGNTTGIVDYGPNNCDDQAIITINGKDYAFTMN